VRTEGDEAAARLKKAISDDQRLGSGVNGEKEYYAGMTSSGAPLEALGFFVAAVMSVGSAFAATNTMYAAVARRAGEIGTLRALGVTSSKRMEVLPDVPAIAETFHDDAAGSWAGIGAPVGTPPEIAARLNAGINAALSDEKIRKIFNDQAQEPAGGTIERIAMDEPLSSGAGPCRLSITDTAARTASYPRSVLAQQPHAESNRSVRIGDIEPYPSFSVHDLKNWISALAADGVVLDFLHLDINVHYVNVHSQTRLGEDLAEIQSFLKSSNIPFGIIFWSGYDPLNSDKMYYDDTMDLVRNVHDAIGRPDQIIFQSWVTRSPMSCAASTPGDT